jgi:hypothetical protein
VAHPWLWFDKHGEVTGMQSFLQIVLYKPLGNHRIQPDHAELLPSYVLIAVEKSGLYFGSMKC